MKRARIMQRRGDEQGVATPYAIEDGRASAIPYEWYVTNHCANPTKKRCSGVKPSRVSSD